MEEKRRYPRFSFNEPVGYQKEGQSLEGSLADDISQTGIKLSVSQFIPLNTELELQVQLPGQLGVIPAHGKVVWIREVPHRDDAWEVGLRIDQDEEFKLAIQEYITLYRLESLS
jgi:hypothetical protein